MKIKLEKVKYMPQKLEPGVLYVSYEYKTAAHLCACGCGVKIRTPLGKTEWSVDEDFEGPSLWPSVGNWQQKCNSHYVIRSGEVIWADTWSAKKIEAGRKKEMENREKYYKLLELDNAETQTPQEHIVFVSEPKKSAGTLARILHWINRLFS